MPKCVVNTKLCGKLQKMTNCAIPHLNVASVPRVTHSWKDIKYDDGRCSRPKLEIIYELF